MTCSRVPAELSSAAIRSTAISGRSASLDFEHDPHVVRFGPVERLRYGRYLRPDEIAMEPSPRVQPADLFERRVRCKAVSVGRPVDGQVVQDDRLAVRGQHDVDLDRGRPRSLGCLECRQGILRVVGAVAAVAADMDTPRLAGQEAEGHIRLNPS
jgi:hypothetical protein